MVALISGAYKRYKLKRSHTSKTMTEEHSTATPMIKKKAKDHKRKEQRNGTEIKGRSLQYTVKRREEDRKGTAEVDRERRIGGSSRMTIIS